MHGSDPFSRWQRLVVLVLVGMAGSALAAPLARDRVPAPLQPWVDWVLQGHEAERCPTLGTNGERTCAWPSRLRLSVEARGGHFTQRWLAVTDTWVPLPGDAKLWPQDVQVDGRGIAVTPSDETPGVRLTAGSHDIVGTFVWDTPPELLQIPRATGLVDLTVHNQPIAQPNRDGDGRLWIAKREASDDGDAHLDIAVHRRLTDNVPLLLTTQIDLKVSGRSRETLLGRALPEGFVPLALEAPMPARIEPDGRLRVQLRPGAWSITLLARRSAPAEALQRPQPDGPWSEEEVWAFESQPQVRVASIEGVTAVDPQQTLLPAAWRSLPAYLVRLGDTVQLVERRRGDDEPPADQLTMDRTWWLDFDGRGFTMRDTLRGPVHRSWRLEMEAPAVLGRIALRGQDQPINRRSDDGLAGVEVRNTPLALDADSRIDGPLRELPVVGWTADVAEMSGHLHLPPGWRLFHATGVDAATPSWVTQWTLLDLFLVLVFAMATGRLWGMMWGALALGTLALTWHEVDAPQSVWLAVLVGEALLRVVPTGTFQRVLQLLHAAAMVGLVAIALTFMVGAVRIGIYPALERPGDATEMYPRSVAATMEAPYAESEPAEQDAGAPDGEEADRVAPIPAPAAPSVRKTKRVEEPHYQIDTRAKVSTGPGVPEWGWREVDLIWRGPVEASQTMHLYLVPPWINLLLGLARFALVGVLVSRMLRRPSFAVPPAAMAVVLLGVLVAPSSARADYPPAELLEQLRQRLLAPTECAPSCASASRLGVTIAGQTLRLQLEVHAAADVAVPLPGGANDWLPATITLDGQPADGLSRSADGTLWLLATAGAHRVVLEGFLPARETIRLPLPLHPHRVDVAATGWTIDGVHDDGTVDDALQLTRTTAAEAAAENLEPVTLPAFVSVERTLQLGLTWEVHTTVTRQSPAGSAIVVDVPLLPGEAITSGDVRVADNVASVSFGPQAAAVSWHSTLREQPELTLSAPALADAAARTEIWHVDASPIWHIEASGIPVLQPSDDDALRQRTWQPWPGESVVLTITRPTGVAGQTLTIDRSELAVRPGLRSTDATLTLMLRSSQGTQHAITLPPAATLQTVTIDGLTQPIRQEGARVVLPLTPASRQVQLIWHESPGGIARWFTTPVVDLGSASVNDRLTVEVPADRWILALGGPRLGPAVLFWSTVIALVPVSIALARTGLTPLGAVQWFLLGIGLTQIPIWAALVVAGWLLALGWRGRNAGGEPFVFDLRQIVLGLWTVVALTLLFWAIQHGLLGAPEMQIAGNGSDGWMLRWYADRAAGPMPTAWVLSVPLLAYRLAMLAWALWLANALLRWLSWGWQCFSTGGVWHSAPEAPRVPPPVKP